MKKKSNLLSLICLFLSIAATSLIYFLLVDEIFSSPVKWLSLYYVLFAEIILFAKFMSRAYSDALKPHAFSGCIYLALTILLSLFYLSQKEPELSGFIVVHVLLIIVLCVIDILALYCIKRSLTPDKTMAKCKTMVDIIIAENPDCAFKKELTDISESIRYSDDSKLCGNEKNIVEKITDLKETIKSLSDEEINERIISIKTLIEIRNIDIKQKQGGKF